MIAADRTSSHQPHRGAEPLQLDAQVHKIDSLVAPDRPPGELTDQRPNKLESIDNLSNEHDCSVAARCDSNPLPYNDFDSQQQWCRSTEIVTVGSIGMSWWRQNVGRSCS